MAQQFVILDNCRCLPNAKSCWTKLYCIIVLPDAARTKWGTKLEDSRVAAFRSLIHKKQVARMEYKKLESTAIILCQGEDDDQWEMADATLNHALALSNNHDIGFAENSGNRG